MQANPEAFGRTKQPKRVEPSFTRHNETRFDPTVEHQIGERKSSGGCCGSDQFGNACNERDPCPGLIVAAYLDTHGTNATLAVWTLEHRKSRGQPISPIGRQPRLHSLDLGECSLDDQRSRNFGLITVVRTDRFGEPCQQPTGSGPRRDLGAVVEVGGRAGERSVMLSRTRRARSAVYANMNLVNGRQRIGEMASEQPDESRRHTCSDHERHTVLNRQGVEVEKCANVVNLVADRHNRNAALQKATRNKMMWPRVSEDHCAEAAGQR